MEADAMRQEIVNRFMLIGAIILVVAAIMQRFEMQLVYARKAETAMMLYQQEAVRFGQTVEVQVATRHRVTSAWFSNNPWGKEIQGHGKREPENATVCYGGCVDGGMLAPVDGFGHAHCGDRCVRVGRICLQSF